MSRFLRHGKRWWLWTAAWAATLPAGGCGPSGEGARREAAPALERYELGGDFELVDQRGERFSLSGRRGRPLLLFFGFTRCAASCPTTLSKLGEVMRRLPAPGVEVLFLSVDPGHDTPARLAEYCAGYPYRLTGLTGTLEQVAAVAGQYGAGFGPAADGGVDHSSRTYLIDAQGVVRFLFSEQDGIDDMAAVIRRLL